MKIEYNGNKYLWKKYINKIYIICKEYKIKYIENNNSLFFCSNLNKKVEKKKEEIYR